MGLGDRRRGVAAIDGDAGAHEIMGVALPKKMPLELARLAGTPGRRLRGQL